MQTTTMLERIPHQLKERSQWLLWGQIDGDGKISKRPVDAQGRWASKTDTNAHMTFGVAAHTALNRGLGMGFCLLPDDKLVCIDLDNAIDEEGLLRRWAEDIVKRFRHTYIERSASGRGLHIFCFAPKTNGTSTIEVVEGDKNQAIDFLSRNQFVALTGDQWQAGGPLAVVRCDDDLEWLLDRHPLDNTKAVATLADAQSPMGVVFGRLNEIMAGRWVGFFVDQGIGHEYLDGKHHPCPKCGGKDRFRMIDEPVGALFCNQCFNRRNGDGIAAHAWWRGISLSTAWDEIAQWCGFDDGQPAIDLTFTPTVKSMSLVIPDEPVEEVDEYDDYVVPEWPTSIERPPGLLSDLTDYLEASSFLYQPEAALAASCAFLAGIAGHSYETDRSRWALNSYFIVLGATAGGKSACVDPLLRLASLAGCSNRCEQRDGRAGTAQGIYARLQTDPSLTLILDEFHQLLQAARNPKDLGARVMDTLKILYNEQEVTQADLYADVAKNREVHRAHLAFLGLTVPELFWASLSKGNVSDGFLNRCLVWEIRDPHKDQNPDGGTAPDPGLVETIRMLGSRKGWLETPRIKLAMHPEAKEMLTSYSRAVRAKHREEDEDHRSIWARAAEKVERLARLAAVSDNLLRPIVLPSHIVWAKSVVNYSHRFIAGNLNQVGKTDYMQYCDDVEKAIKKAKDGITIGRLRNRFRHLAERKRLEAVIETLVGMGRVELREGTSTPRGGRPTLRYHHR